MWIVGTLVFYLFYRLAIAWYLNLWTMARRSGRPLAWEHGWFHCFILGVSALLLAASGFIYYRSYPWLALAPIPLTAIALVAFWIRRRKRLNGIISRAVTIQVRMEGQGEPQPKINQAIYLDATGEGCAGDFEDDLKMFLKYGVLRSIGLFTPKSDISRPDPNADEIDFKIDSLYEVMKRNDKNQGSDNARSML